MRNVWKRLLTCLMCLALLSGGIPAARADGTTLEVSFQGLIGQADGQWRTVMLSGSFAVWQDGQEIGSVTVDDGKSSVVTLDNIANAQLIPQMDTMPADYLIQEAGYSASVTEGRLNTALVMAYADSGLFTWQGIPNAGYTLTNEADEEVLSFTTDETGYYALPEALTSGLYTVRQENDGAAEATWPDFTLTISAYRGNQEQILHVDEAYAQANVIVVDAATAEPTVEPTAEPTEEPTEESTAEPTVEPTVEPTIEPTAEPTAEPTEEPTAEPTVEPTEEPTAEPTAEPTEVPTPTPIPVGSLVLEAAGSGEAADYQIEKNGVVEAQGNLMGGQSISISDLPAGEYDVLLTLQEGTVLTGLNSRDVMQKDQAKWKAEVEAGVDNVYHLMLDKTGGVQGEMKDVPDGAVITLKGEDDHGEATLTGGTYTVDGLCPGVYTASVSLPEGGYSAEGWQLTAAEGCVIANANVLVESGETAMMPGITRLPNASVSGRVTDEQGNGLPGIKIILTNEAGEQAACVETAADGSWLAQDLRGGSYTVAVENVAGLAAGSQTLTVGENEQVTGVLLTAGQPAALTVWVYIDANNNGERGTYERPLPGTAVSVLNALTGLEAGQAVTDEEGKAVLTGLAAGDYMVRTVLPDGYGYGKLGKNGKPNSSSIMDAEVGTTQSSQPFALTAGEEVDVSVGATQMAAVSGKCWQDVNGDGVMNDDESGQAGVKIEMIGERNGLTYEFITGDSGEYYIGQIRPGSYKLQVTTPDGMMFTKYTKYGGEKRSCITTEGKSTSSLSLEMKAGQEVDKRHIGVVVGSTIQLRCFLDANYNGLYDEGEAPLAGVVCELLKQGSGKSVTKVTSDENGLATFTALRANTYKVNALLPSGCTFTAVSDQADGNKFKARKGRREYTVDNLAITTGESVSMVVGAVMPGSISGTAYLDDNFSATRDQAEKAVSGLTVTLLDEAGETVDTARTNGKGVYTFEGLNPGAYKLRLNAKSGYAFTKLGEGNVIVNTGDGTGESALLELPLGASLSGMNMGMILPGVVEGSVFMDANDNGMKDETEVGFAGTKVSLMDENGEVFSAMLDETGLFRFDAVMPGRYYVRYELPEDGVFAQTVSGGNTLTGSGDGIGATDWFDFATGAQVTAPVCGGLTLGSVTGHAFADHNGNGLQDDGEEAMAGVTIQLKPSRSDIEALQATTQSDGAFELTNLRPDSYEMTVTWPEGYVMSRTDGLTLPLAPGSNEQSVSLTVDMGVKRTEQALGGVKPASLRGQVWLDENNDGRFNSDEATPAGETVTVIDEATGMTFATLATDQDGVFSISGLIPGSYTLTFGPTLAPQEGDCNFTYENGMLVMRNVAVQEGGSVDGLTAAAVRYTSLSGKAWVDMGGSVLPQLGAAVELLDDSGATIQSTTTGEAGEYRFDELLPGTYFIRCTLPEGRVAVEPEDERLADGSLTSILKDCQGRTGVSEAIEVKMDQHQNALDIGAVLPGTIGDLCWLDLNGNGLQDSGESGIPGVKVELIRGDDVAAEAVSDQYGYYLIKDVYPAVYTLKVTPPQEVKPTVRNTQFPMIVSVLEETEETTAYAHDVAVVSDKHSYDVDLGFVLRQDGAYPAGYGQGATQDWTKPAVTE